MYSVLHCRPPIHFTLFDCKCLPDTQWLEGTDTAIFSLRQSPQLQTSRSNQILNVPSWMSDEHLKSNVSKTELFIASCSRTSPSDFQISGHSNCSFPDAQTKNLIANLDSFYFFLYAIGWHILSNLPLIYPKSTTYHLHYYRGVASHHYLSPGLLFHPLTGLLASILTPQSLIFLQKLRDPLRPSSY